MNLSIPKRTSKNRRRFAAHYLAAAIGIALAIGGAGVVRRSEAGPQTPAIRPPALATAAMSSSSDLVSERFTFYLVDSEEQRDSLIASALGDDFPAHGEYIVVIRSQADERSMAATQAELTYAGHSAEVVDLRNREQ